MLGELVPCGGGPPIPLLKPRLTLGRDRSCDIPLAFRTVSGRHCELEFRDGFWLLRDLGSSNGTKVNGAACSSRWLLPGDVLAVAQCRYTVAYTPPGGRMPPREAQPAAAPPPRAAAPPPARVAAGSGPSLGELVPCGGGDPIPLHKKRVVVGRHLDCDVVIPSGVVSGRHCQLDLADGHWSVRDLGSRNGIRVDGVPCQEKELPTGSILSIAILRYRVLYGTPAAAPAGKPASPFGQSLLEKAGLSRWRLPDDSQPVRPARPALDEEV
jgi:adenylate cyclase